MKKVVLHIGCEKTGTTSIQRYLSENRDKLLSEYGVLYPRSLGRSNHTKFAIYACDESRGLTRFLNRDEDLKSFREALEISFLNEVKSYDWSTLIISAEWLHPRVKSTEEFSRIKNLLKKIAGKIEILMYVRRQDEMAVSLYSTSLKSGSYNDFNFPSITSAKLPYYYDFFTIYKCWRSMFGVGNVEVRVFDKEALYGGDILKDFLNLIGVDEIVDSLARRENQSLSDEGVILLKAFNFWVENNSCKISISEKKRIREEVSKKFSGKSNVVSQYEMNAFYKAFSESNSKLKYHVEKDLSKIFRGL